MSVLAGRLLLAAALLGTVGSTLRIDPCQLRAHRSITSVVSLVERTGDDEDLDVPRFDCLSMAGLLASSEGIAPCPVNISPNLVLIAAEQVAFHQLARRAYATYLSSPTRQYSPNHLGKERIPYDQSPDCGARCLYLLLNFLGDRRDFAAVLAAVPRLSDRGASLADLQEAARTFSLATVVAQGATDRLPLPAIARLLPRVASGDGHFVLLYKVTPEEVAYIDGTTGALVRQARGDFDGHFSGFALIPEATAGVSEHRRLVPTILKYIVVGEVVILILMLMYDLRRKHSRRLVVPIP